MLSGNRIRAALPPEPPVHSLLPFRTPDRSPRLRLCRPGETDRTPIRARSQPIVPGSPGRRMDLHHEKLVGSEEIRSSARASGPVPSPGLAPGRSLGSEISLGARPRHPHHCAVDLLDSIGSMRHRQPRFGICPSPSASLVALHRTRRLGIAPKVPAARILGPGARIRRRLNLPQQRPPPNTHASADAAQSPKRRVPDTKKVAEEKGEKKHNRQLPE